MTNKTVISRQPHATFFNHQQSIIFAFLMSLTWGYRATPTDVLVCYGVPLKEYLTKPSLTAKCGRATAQLSNAKPLRAMLATAENLKIYHMIFILSIKSAKIFI
jgi:hypothetical protein